MKLNEQQVLQIKEYIHSRGFTDLEVETEIVDHVASAVEDQLADDPEMSLEEAIYNVHWSFGLFGFERMEAAVAQGLREQLWQLYKSNFGKQWSTKQILFNLATASTIILLLSILPQIFPFLNIRLTFFCAVTIISLIPLLYHVRTFRKWKKRSMLTGKHLIPYAASGYWIACVLQFTPDIWYDSPLFLNGVLIFASLWLSTNLLTGLSMVSEMNKWTYERWLKYQT